MNTPSLNSRPLLLALGPLWNVARDTYGLGYGIVTDGRDSYPELEDCEGADKSVAAYLLEQLKTNGFEFHDCFMNKIIELEEDYIEAREGNVIPRGDVNGFPRPLDRTLEIPSMHSNLYSVEIVQGLCQLLRDRHPLWRVAFLFSQLEELMVYPDCVRRNDTITTPEECGPLIAEWKNMHWIREAPDRQRCEEMAEVLLLLRDRWPENDIPKVLRVYRDGAFSYVWIAYPNVSGEYYTLNIPRPASLGSVHVDINMTKSKHAAKERGISCIVECERHPNDVTALNCMHTKSGQEYHIPIPQ